MHALLTVAEMYEADRRAIAGGVSGIALMEAAGLAVVSVIEKHYPQGAVAVLCGPGNNGGDGFVIARLLKLQGWSVSVGFLGEMSALSGDAAEMAALWVGDVGPVNEDIALEATLVVDALFGAGLSRDISDDLAALMTTIYKHGIPVVAVDIPSGIDGLTGEVRGQAFRAEHTVTFCRKKPGHVLLPGREHCGDVTVADIGISDDVVTSLSPTHFENARSFWLAHFPLLSAASHKYTRGAVISVSGPSHQTGAARLAARGALRVGSGVVTVASPKSAMLVNASHLTAIMVKSFGDAQALNALLRADSRIGAVVIGPGAGAGDTTRQNVRAVLDAGVPTVLDADALSAFSQDPEALFAAIKVMPGRAVVLTPHEGEFRRLFPEIAQQGGSKAEKARQAATLSGCIIVFKGPDTVIADLDGCVVINTNAPPSLATAGSGDVLAGMIAGLMAQGMSAHKAAAAGVWLHGEAANLFGSGLIAEDIPEILPQVFKLLQGANNE